MMKHKHHYYRIGRELEYEAMTGSTDIVYIFFCRACGGIKREKVAQTDGYAS